MPPCAFSPFVGCVASVLFLSLFGFVSCLIVMSDVEADDHELLLLVPAKKRKARATCKALFIYIGSVIVMFVMEMMVPCFEVITWNFTDELSSTVLRNAHHDAYAKVKADLRKLKDAGIVSKLLDGKFTLATGCRTGEYDKFYVYQHARHAMFSNVTFTSIATFASITETNDYVSDRCDRHRGHESILPYFYGDLLLDKTLERLEAGEDSERATMLRRAIECTRKGEQRSRGGHLCENDWSYRLNECLKLSGLNAEYTAEYGKHHKRYWKSKLPEGLDEKCFVFRGSPDLIIHDIKEDCAEDTVVVTGQQNMEVAGCSNTENGSSDTETSCSTISSVTLEMAKQCTKPYKVTSSIPEKGGQLIAAIHLKLVCKVLRKIANGEPLTRIVGHGLLVLRGVSIIHMKVTMSNEPLQVNVAVLTDSLFTPDILCNSFDYYFRKIAN